MRILRTYILREHLSPFFVTLGGLIAVLLIGNLIKFAELVIAKGVNPIDLLRLLLYLIPFILTFAVPMACLIAMVLAFGRLSTDYELIAMRASGVAPFRLVTPVLVTGLVLSTMMLAINDRIAPKSHLAFRRQLKSIAVKQPTAYLEAGTFIKDFVPYVIFVYHVDGKKLNNVRIYEPQPNGPTRTIIADRGEFQRAANKREIQLKLYDGTVDEWDTANPGTFFKIAFTTYTMTLNANRDDPERMGKKLKEMTLRELASERGQLSAQQIEILPVSLELHRRIASSAAPLVFMLFGLVLGLQLHHHERLTGFVWILAIFLCYYLGLIGMDAVAIKRWLPPALAMWIPNLLGCIISAPMIIRTVRR